MATQQVKQQPSSRGAVDHVTAALRPIQLFTNLELTQLLGAHGRHWTLQQPAPCKDSATQPVRPAQSTLEHRQQLQ